MHGCGYIHKRIMIRKKKTHKVHAKMTFGKNQMKDLIDDLKDLDATMVAYVARMSDQQCFECISRLDCSEATLEELLLLAQDFDCLS